MWTTITMAVMCHLSYKTYHLDQEYIIEREESILLHYGPVLQHFTGVHDRCNNIHMLEASVLAVCGHVAKPQVQ